MRRLSHNANNIKAGYQTMYHTYVLRRNYLKRKHGMTHSRSRTEATAEYYTHFDILTKKMHTLKKAIRRIEVYENKIKEVGLKMQEFMGFEMQGARCPKDPKLMIARSIMIKYLLERRVPGPHLLKYFDLGKTKDGKLQPRTGGYCGQIRQNFTRSFATNPENRDLYHRFVRYMSEPE